MVIGHGDMNAGIGMEPTYGNFYNKDGSSTRTVWPTQNGGK
jgi:hypothetical protein